MRYTLEKRLDIGKKVFSHELTYKEASEQYAISQGCVANYVKLYKETNGFVSKSPRASRFASKADLDSLHKLNKEQLIDEVIKARIGEERAKKGYMVKGGGRKKEYVSISNKNTR